MQAVHQYSWTLVLRPLNTVSCIVLFLERLKRRRIGINIDEKRNSIKGTIMQKGTVKWFNSTKGYGFIQPEDGSKDVFVHISALEQAGISNLLEGQKVSFELTSNKGKTSATNLSVE